MVQELVNRLKAQLGIATGVQANIDLCHMHSHFAAQFKGCQILHYIAVSAETLSRIQHALGITWSAVALLQIYRELWCRAFPCPAVTCQFTASAP